MQLFSANELLWENACEGVNIFELLEQGWPTCGACAIRGALAT